MVGTGDRGWRITRERGLASALHARTTFEAPRRSAYFCEVERSALVLGPSQSESIVDRHSAEARGVEIVKRRSGGGAVLLIPGEVLWVDLLVPLDDWLWNANPSRAAWWIGDTWAMALADCGMEGGQAHRGPMVKHRWSSLVCFAGIGPGEVLIGNRKIVGLCQRRSANVALFQCMLHWQWRPDALLSLLKPPKPSAAALPPVATAGASTEALISAFIARLPA